MFDTPKTSQNEGLHSTCPSPPRPKTNFVNTNTPSSVRQSSVPSAVHRDPPARGPPTSTFTSLASDGPSLTLMHDDEDEECSSSSSSENGFFLLSPAGATRPIFYYPTAVRNNSTTNAVPQSRYGCSLADHHHHELRMLQTDQ